MQFTQGLHRAVQQTPRAIATICDGRSQDFIGLQDRVARLASAFRQLGVKNHSRVAICSLNSDYYIEAYLAIAWAGAVCVPLNYRWSVEELRTALNDCTAELLLVDGNFVTMVDDIAPPSSTVLHFIQFGPVADREGVLAGDQLIASSAPMADRQSHGDDLLGIFYTGGTTGASKGVMLTHNNLCTSALSMMAEGMFQPGGVGLHVAPMFHLADMLMLTCLILRGNTHVVLSTFQPDLLLETVEKQRVTDTLLVPTMLQAIVDFPSVDQFDLGSLQHILYGASPASEVLIAKVLAAFPHAELLQGYGMTESAAFLAALPAAVHRAPTANRLRSAGRATFDVQLKIVDGDDAEIQRGSIGEIVARGPNIMLGYLNLPDATSQTLRGGWLHTGDLGYMDDEGYVFIVDRLKDMIITGGENVYSVEVENAIAKHPAVTSVAVVGVPCDAMGEKVHAAIVLKSGMTLDLEQLRDHCRTYIAGYKCPRSLSILSEMPMSGAGKILKTDIRLPYWKEEGRNVS